MSLAHIQIDPYFLAKIFTQPIIPGERPATIMPTAPPTVALPPIKFLGENQKNIALLIDNPNEVYLNDELFNLLTNILNACKLGMQDVALINLHAYPGISLEALQKAVPMQQAVFFGIDPEMLALQGIALYQVNQAGGSSVLYSHDLSFIAQDKVMKGRLWTGLKQLLGL
ncbi:hypothetical protein GA0116948_101577 [Chitinophaga costaii]|uniref:Uncharacterized protein n=1 Tax=Chitinophaga costaii TaxID=1335309 RepID=A0A1C3ZW71_9BACT|nr:hypothetical protein [Chitinophaga costaii]PUZ30527.1 hypothetical protein DCM91_03425 [Chitinophaga costaii]SCB86545.1 hypothetical protein GA0116948_101577 [Chitinophaga costaii]